MANEKLTDKAAFPGGGSAQATDLYHSVVVNDSTGSASGTSTKQTYQQLQDGVNLLTEITEIDPDADFIATYDTSGTATKKVHPQFLQPMHVPTAITASSYTATIDNAYSFVVMSKASGQNFTIPPASSVAFPLGTIIKVLQFGAGQVTIVAGSGVTLYQRSALTINDRYGVATCIRVAADKWSVSGDLD